MDDRYLYQKIAEAIRQEIFNHKLKPGDQLPSVRAMSNRWNCTIGTVQRAYRELTDQGLVTSRAGQGTRVVEQLPLMDDIPLRRANLVHRAEAFLLEALTSGYTPEEVEDSIRQALDHWRAVNRETPVSDRKTLRFAGSHDLVITWLASHFSEIAPGVKLKLSFNGSLGGLIALANHEADLAGCHLWDEPSKSYNMPYVQRLLPNRRIALVNLAQRHLGLILPPGNPNGVRNLRDLLLPGTRFANRQSGSGTRIWLEARLKEIGIDPAAINGYANEKMTHSEVAREVAEERANAGLGLEAAARSYGLDFIHLAREVYDLILPAENLTMPAIQALLHWLGENVSHDLITGLGGYDASRTGIITWSE
jgi:molybdate-binding protein/DNA-binding transcriptional regulator YhcF (GntR family)